MLKSQAPFMFDKSLTGSKVDLFLDFKLPQAENPSKSRDVQQARVLYELIRKNVSRLRVFYNFIDIKNVFAMRTQMGKWKEEAQHGKTAVYYIYPKNDSKCVGCLKIDNNIKNFELSAWLDENATGKGYMQDAMNVIERSLFEKDAKELIRRFWIGNENKEAILHNIQKAGYTPCPALDGTSDDVFKTFHKTRDMYNQQQAKFNPKNSFSR